MRSAEDDITTLIAQMDEYFAELKQLIASDAIGELYEDEVTAWAVLIATRAIEIKKELGR